MGLKEKMEGINARDSIETESSDKNLFKAIDSISDLRNVAIGDFLETRGSFRINSVSNITYDLNFENLLFDESSISSLSSLYPNRNKGISCTNVVFKVLVVKIDKLNIIVSLLNLNEIETLLLKQINSHARYDKKMEDLTEKANEAISELASENKTLVDKNNALASENKTILSQTSDLKELNKSICNKYNSLVDKYNVIQSNYSTLYKLYQKKNDFSGFAVKVGLTLIMLPISIILLMKILEGFGLV